jgi:hypothetical protein
MQAEIDAVQALLAGGGGDAAKMGLAGISGQIAQLVPIAVEGTKDEFLISESDLDALLGFRPPEAAISFIPYRDTYLKGQREVVDRFVPAEHADKPFSRWKGKLINDPLAGGLRSKLVNLTVTYYTGVQDQVPHVPEECVFQGGMTQNGAKVTIEIAPTNAVYSATLNGDELSGTLAQGALTLPLVMKRAAR